MSTSATSSLLSTGSSGILTAAVALDGPLARANERGEDNDLLNIIDDEDCHQQEQATALPPFSSATNEQDGIDVAAAVSTPPTALSALALITEGLDAPPPPLLLPSSSSTAASASTEEEQEWDRDKAADEVSREALKARFREPGFYTREEEESFERGAQMEIIMLADVGRRGRGISLRGGSKVQTSAARVPKIREIDTKRPLLKARTALDPASGILYGQVSCEISAPAVDVLAFYMDSNSYVINKYERGSSTIEMKTLEAANNHRTVLYFLGNIPPPFRPREFVGNAMWRKEGEEQDEHYFIVNVPIEHDLAPLLQSYVRAESVRALRLQETSPGVTSLTLTFTMDLKGNIPSWITRNIAIPANLDGPVIYQRYFMFIKRAEDFDKSGHDAATLAQLLMDDIFVTAGADDARREEVLRQYFVRAAALRSVAGSYPWFKTFLRSVVAPPARLRSSESKPPSLETSGVVHPPILNTFSSVDAEAAALSLTTSFDISAAKMSPELATRLWMSQHPAMLELEVELVLFRPFITHVVKCLLGAKGGLALSSKEWEQDAEADRGSRELIKLRIRNPGEYTKEEEAGFERGLHMENLLSPNNDSKPPTKMSSFPRVVLSKNFDSKKQWELKVLKPLKTRHSFLKARTAYNKANGVLFGHVECLVRARAIDVLAFMIDIESRVYNKHDKGKSTVEQRTIELKSNRCQVIYALTKLPAPFQMREFVGNVTWREESENHFMYVYAPTDHDKAPPSNNVVRGESTRAVRLREVSPGVTMFTHTFTADMKGLLPTAVTNKVVIPTSLYGACRYQRYFLCIKPASDFDSEDTNMLAQLMLDDMYSRKTIANREEAMQQYFVRAAALRAVSSKYPWLQVLLWNLIRNKVRPTATCNTALVALSFAEAIAIGRSFPATLLSCTTGEMAADEWILSYPAMQELDAELPMLRPLVTTFARGSLERATWGSKARVIAGALLSFCDILTDINMIHQFYTRGKIAAAIAMILLISLNLAGQIFIVHIQNRRKSRIVLVREIIIVMTFLKPAVDAHRIIKGGEKDPYLALDPLLESAYAKAAEVAFEAIGGSILQAFFFVTSDTKTPLAIVSIVTSALTIAYTVTTITFDMDTSAENRRRVPELWGMMPDRQRGRVFILMVILSTSQVVAKVFSIALLAATNAVWLLAWLSVDLLSYFFYRAARQDFIYFSPGLTGGTKYAMALLLRTLQKVLVDVTGILLMRNPYEMGGIYFSFNMVSSQASCWVAASLYSVYYDADEYKISDYSTYEFIGFLQALWIVTLLMFLKKIKRDFLKSFYSTQTGRQNAMSLFLDHENDESKAKVFLNHEDLWSDIRDEVKVYMLLNWARWEAEKPLWFSENFKATVPDEFIPKVALDALSKQGGGLRRRSSAGLVAKFEISEWRGSTVAPEETVQ